MPADLRESIDIEGKEWLTCVDSLVCSICGPLHGVIVPRDEKFEGGFDGPPAHKGCRCDLAPVPAGDDEIFNDVEYVEGVGFVKREIAPLPLNEEEKGSDKPKQSIPSRPWWKFWKPDKPEDD